MYNHRITGDITMSMTAKRMDEHHIPCVILKGKNQDVISNDNRVDNGEQPSGQLLRSGRLQRYVGDGGEE